jgi:hypothetical protein
MNISQKCFTPTSVEVLNELGKILQEQKLEFYCRKEGIDFVAAFSNEDNTCVVFCKSSQPALAVWKAILELEEELKRREDLEDAGI